MQMIAETELFQACRVIFEAEPIPSRNFLRSLSLVCLKSAYRRRALQVHPDLHAQQQTRVQQHYSRLFQELTGGYRLLRRYLDQQSRRRAEGFAAAGRPFRAKPRSSNASGFRTSPRPADSANRQPPASGAAGGVSGPPVPGRRHSRAVPPWKMRLGEFLYYSGQISWKALIAALVRQRTECPRLGDIAKRWGWLTEDRIVALLKQRRPGERIGDLFVRRRLITAFRLGMLLSQQRRHSKPIGDILVEAGLLSQSAIRAGLLRQHTHNRRRKESGIRNQEEGGLDGRGKAGEGFRH
ncbi:MAG: hypothetical protein V3T83_10415 [Acidobacteriota bacterium]